MSVKDTISTVFAKLPFKALAEKIPSAARAKVPLLDKAIPFANQIACGLLAVLLVTAVACSKKAEAQDGGSGGGSSGGSSRSSVRESPVSDFSYDLTADGRGIKITKYTGSDTAIAIPSRIEDMPVLEIGERVFIAKSEITSMVIPNTVEVIGDSAFLACTGITSIVIPNSVKTIGDSAFGQTGLTSIVIPDSVETIGRYAFYSCANLTKITLPDGLKVLQAYVFSGGFSGTSKLTSINLPASLETIREYAFGNCGELTELIIPDSLSRVTFYSSNGERQTASYPSDSFEGCGKLPLRTRQRIQELGYLGTF